MAQAPPEKLPKPGLNIYGATSPNPYKLSIALEELGLKYNYITMSMSANEHKSEWYTAINPNGRLPAIVDVREDGTTVTVFETAACLIYLVNTYDKDHKLSYPTGTPEYYTQLSWVAWQVAGYGPTLGQSSYFHRYSQEPVPHAMWRFVSESRRLNHVLNEQLSKHPFVAGDRMTIADCAIFPFAHCNMWCGVDISEFEHVVAWHDRLLKRPGVLRGMETPVPFPFSDEAVSDPDPTKQEFFKFMRKMAGQVFKKATDSWAGKSVTLPSDHADYLSEA